MPMDQNLEHPNNEFSIPSKIFHFKSWYLGVGTIIAIILCSMIGVTHGLFFLFLLSALVVQHPALYLLLVGLLFIISIIGILKSDKSDNAKLFYASAFLFCLSIIGGILYFIFPAIFWLVTRD
jgi:hypothetical protein